MFGHLVSSSPPSSWAHNSLPDHPPQGEDAPPAVISNASSSNDVPSSPSPLAATPTTQRQQRASDEDQDQDDVLVALEREESNLAFYLEDFVPTLQDLIAATPSLVHCLRHATRVLLTRSFHPLLTRAYNHPSGLLQTTVKAQLRASQAQGAAVFPLEQLAVGQGWTARECSAKALKAALRKAWEAEQLATRGDERKRELALEMLVELRNAITGSRRKSLAYVTNSGDSPPRIIPGPSIVVQHLLSPLPSPELDQLPPLTDIDIPAYITRYPGHASYQPVQSLLKLISANFGILGSPNPLGHQHNVQRTSELLAKCLMLMGDRLSKAATELYGELLAESWRSGTAAAWTQKEAWEWVEGLKVQEAGQGEKEVDSVKEETKIVLWKQYARMMSKAREQAMLDEFEGDEYQTKGEHARAVELFRSAIENDPNGRPRLLLKRAISLRAQNLFSSAEADLSILLALPTSPSHAPARALHKKIRQKLRTTSSELVSSSGADPILSSAASNPPSAAATVMAAIEGGGGGGKKSKETRAKAKVKAEAKQERSEALSSSADEVLVDLGSGAFSVGVGLGFDIPHADSASKTNGSIRFERMPTAVVTSSLSPTPALSMTPTPLSLYVSPDTSVTSTLISPSSQSPPSPSFNDSTPLAASTHISVSKRTHPSSPLQQPSSTINDDPSVSSASSTTSSAFISASIGSTPASSSFDSPCTPRSEFRDLSTSLTTLPPSCISSGVAWVAATVADSDLETVIPSDVGSPKDQAEPNNFGGGDTLLREHKEEEIEVVEKKVYMPQERVFEDGVRLVVCGEFLERGCCSTGDACFWLHELPPVQPHDVLDSSVNPSAFVIHPYPTARSHQLQQRTKSSSPV